MINKHKRAYDHTLNGLTESSRIRGARAFHTNLQDRLRSAPRTAKGLEQEFIRQLLEAIRNEPPETQEK